MKHRYPMLKLGMPIDGVKREWEMKFDENQSKGKGPKVCEGIEVGL